MIITRDDKTWLYSVTEDDGSNVRQLPSVTTIIDAALHQFDGLPPAAMERVKNAGEFGRAVHTLTELDDKGILDEESLDPNLMPILQAWRRFKVEFEFHYCFSLIFAEYKISSKLGYAGTIDRIAQGHDGSWVVLEIKSRPYMVGRDGLQTAAYAQAFGEMINKKIETRYVLELKLDGTYTLTKNKDANDWNIFRSMLALYNWRKNHGL